jgi:hypothetical protein
MEGRKQRHKDAVIHLELEEKRERRESVSLSKFLV